jgi:hypothetical protein
MILQFIFDPETMVHWLNCKNTNGKITHKFAVEDDKDGFIIKIPLRSSIVTTHSLITSGGVEALDDAISLEMGYLRGVRKALNILNNLGCVDELYFIRTYTYMIVKLNSEILKQKRILWRTVD